ncbi:MULTISPECIES: acyltransferase family protein [unclassified Shewanella]|uniref:acyltransferase family protein n=1 Tax=unclassified Shewanella TaxID=196818 RepID=UPI000C8442F7|nr:MULTISPECIES: DUF5009 domain-containing protein [unclassified Shewanella]MDO6638711.1 DUF5009 domain-containing protein [Shewanella sp. 5_MG-2023]PMH86329.1 DUF5009 domain-containing protein [Shewanella sp. 10N.286.48.B5]
MSTKTALKPRLMSLDALRGFDMFWILGGEGLFAGLFILTGWAGWNWFDGQMHHSQWHGFTFYDVIFPLFIFLSGVALGLSPKRLDKLPMQQRLPLYRHAIKRLGLLIFLGVLYNHGWGVGMPADPDSVRYASVLARIGFAWFIGAMLVWHTSLRTQIIVAISLLIGYGLIQLYLPYPDLTLYSGLVQNPELAQAAVNQTSQTFARFSAENSINAYVDSILLPGSAYQNRAVDPEGVLSTLPAVVNGLIGVFVGHYIVKAKPPLWGLRGEWLKVLSMVIIGAALLSLGWLLDLIIPVNKDLWTSSFVLVTSGWSIILLAIFYAIIDVLKWHKWAFVFVVIGTNAIIIYIASSLVNWQYLANSLLGGFIRATSADWQPLLFVLSLLTVQWLILLWLYQRKIFIRI